MTDPVLTHTQHVEIVERLTRIETTVIALSERMAEWRERHEDEDAKVHAKVEKLEPRVAGLETFKKNTLYLASIAAGVLTTIGATVAAKAEQLLPFLFGGKP